MTPLESSLVVAIPTTLLVLSVLWWITQRLEHLRLALNSHLEERIRSERAAASEVGKAEGVEQERRRADDDTP